MAEYTNPYTARVLRETLALEELEKQPPPEMFTPDERAIRQAQFEQQRREGMALAMSGDKPTEAVGGSLLQEAIRAARPHYTAQGEYDPVAGRLRMYPEVQQQKEIDRRARGLASAELKEAGAEQQRYIQESQAASRAEIAAANRRAQETERAARARLANARAQAEEEKRERGKDITGKPHEELSKLGQGMSDFHTLRNRFEKEWTGAPGGFSILGKAGDVMYGINPQMAPKKAATDRDIWSDVQRLIEAVKRHELFGATLTDNEINNWLTLTPPRGSSAKQMMDWIDKGIARAQEDINARAGSAAAGGGSQTQLETITRGYWKRPEKPKSSVPGPSSEVRDYDPETGDLRG